MFAVSHVDLNRVNHEKDVRKKTIGNIVFSYTLYHLIFPTTPWGE